MTPEGRIKAKVDALLKKYSVYYLKPVQNGMGAPALDYHCILNGCGFCIETKAPGKTLTPRQMETTRRIVRAGGVVWEISADEHIDQLEAWLIIVSQFKENRLEQIDVRYRDPESSN